MEADDTIADRSIEVPARSGAPVEAVEAAADGDVVFLTRDGEPVAAVVPVYVAQVGVRVMEAYEDEEDGRALQAAAEDQEESIPLSEVLKQFAEREAADAESPDAENTDAQSAAGSENTGSKGITAP